MQQLIDKATKSPNYQIADLHIHSRFSRACSRDLSILNIAKTATIKGIDIIATSDFTHHVWIAEIKKDLTEIGNSGLYQLKNQESNTKFILSTEISLIYKKNDKTRRIHIVLLAPNIAAVEKFNEYLENNGYNIKSDGRPILGLDAEKLAEICLNIDERFLIVPAHAWTPWYAIFGSKSGFDSIEECFGKFTDKIYAIETGLSSDPEMNWAVSALDNLLLLSNSDAHSLRNIAREANIFHLEKPSYNEIYQTLKTRDRQKLVKTIEFYPEEGMYNFDGHRDCNISFNPSKIKNKICPQCKKPLTIGVLSRVLDLADHPLGRKPKNAVPYIKLVELDKIIAESFNIKSRASKKVQNLYSDIVREGKNELNILLNLSKDKLLKIAPNKVVEGILRVRVGKLNIIPGFDGQYGQVKIWEGKENIKQANLF